MARDEQDRPGAAVIPLELIAAAVLGLDAAIIAAVVIRRLRGRSASRPGSTVPDAGLPEVGFASSPRPRLEVPSVPRAEPAEGPSRSGAAAPNGWREWVDPTTMAAEATAAWRRNLRRDLLRAGSHRRAGAVVHLELEVPTSTPGEAAHLEGVLLEAIGSVVRPTDHFDHTGPGRFHVLLWDAPSAAAGAVAQRIDDAFGRTAPGRHLLVGVETIASEDDVASASERAARQVEEARRRPPGPAAPR